MNKDIPEGHHEIVVGNVGTILTTDRSRWWEKMPDGPEGCAGFVGRNVADIYAQAVECSVQGYGKYAQEPVTWLIDGDVHKEYQP